MTIIYEVTLRVDRDIADDYDAWLAAHVREMLALPGFAGADIYTVEEDADDDSARVRRVVVYRVESRAALENYFRKHAESMRDDGVRRFGARVSASRRILQRAM